MHNYQKPFTPARFFNRLLLLTVTIFLTFSFCGIDAQNAYIKAPMDSAFIHYLSNPQNNLSVKPAPVDLSHLTGQAVSFGSLSVSVPASYDLRTLGKLPPIRVTQGSSTSCWAYATCASLESCLMPAESWWDFSENNLKNLHGFDNGLSDGGNFFMSTAYLSRWSGPVNESADPFNPNGGVSPAGLPVQKHVQEVLFLPTRSGPSDNNTIKQAIMTYGAVATLMYSNTNDSYFYNSRNYSYYYDGIYGYGFNHAVAIVGWDDNYDRSKFAIVPPGNGAFIVRNSYGTSFGDKGYFYVSYYDYCFGQRNTVFLTEPINNYQRVYQYDPLGWSANLSNVYSSTGGMANVFTAGSNEELLAAISLYTPTINSTYELSIYLGASSGPTSGTLTATQTGTISAAGYHTIKLNQSIRLTAGQKFAVVVKLTTPGYYYPIAIEDKVQGYSGSATANPGESFVQSGTDGTWTDLTSIYPSANVCLKAFTNIQPTYGPFGRGWGINQQCFEVQYFHEYLNDVSVIGNGSSMAVIWADLYQKQGINWVKCGTTHSSTAGSMTWYGVGPGDYRLDIHYVYQQTMQGYFTYMIH